MLLINCNMNTSWNLLKDSSLWGKPLNVDYLKHEKEQIKKMRKESK
jgi:hypothetical protein